ncbi:bifunctional adenosylcobinamide kinase/adenosylcobinamide-phosphate guanylyltransferase [Acetobacterium paludosum]|uniref:Adenosylcobinamide kinase n=1 Tax=Acetobacterium paludosum TaxID=52693 RepID=A0A923KW09_9FIRM|nr:bifunctional adenosylcobinamide kinase/adenosylcobinamide-phosphate guanylyltransferase [Acetobacterium paludosum]MBC3886851.1 bifunctional adenosylcobinamide kinase/adenosylcobinamide-phosphate guanylyltransferase [Acetobacterium paludosum]
MSLIFITGGARSGKSSYAEHLAKELSKPVVYIATAIAFDDGMKDRIAKHQAQRPENWGTIEQYNNFETLKDNPAFQKTDVVLFDCLTVMATNNMLDFQVDYDTCTMDTVSEVEASIKCEVERLLDVCKDKTLIMVSNEVGLGLVPSYKLGSYFRDIAGRMNQLVASRADEVYFTVSGIPMKLK